MFKRIVFAVLAVNLSACDLDSGVSGEGILIESRPNLAYEEMFPYYVELCVTSQYRSKEKATGGVTGHALMYLKGACKDEQATFPQLRRCRTVATTLDDPEHGAGVSVNRWLRNVNWLAIPGYKLFYEGNLSEGQRLTRAHLDRTVSDAIEQGVYDGVEFHDYPTEAEERSLENFATFRSIGTDFALRYARTSFCARLPVSEPMLEEVMSFLNDKNREYATGEADYNWNGLSDNCVHTVRNALAAANVWAPITVWAVRLNRLFNLAVPANEFANLALLVSEGPIENYESLIAENASRDALHEFHWLPTRHGALLKTIPAHEPNDIFDTSFRLFTLTSPFTLNKRNEAVRLLSDKRFVDLQENLEYFSNRYDSILKQTYKDFDGLHSVRGTPYRRVERLHYQYVLAQQAEVNNMLERLQTLKD